MKYFILLLTVCLIELNQSFSFKSPRQLVTRSKLNLAPVTSVTYNNVVHMSDENKDKDNKKKPVVEKTVWEEMMEALKDDAGDDPKKKKGPPIYEPGPYPIHLLSALAYVVPIADSFDLGKYMFEAYPDVLTAYSALFGPVASVYNSVPFLPFAIFFLMSYICRAPTFSTEVRFHFSQAFMLSIIQFVPSLLLGLLEKGGVPGLGVVYNTGRFLFS